VVNPKSSDPYTANVAAAVQVTLREHEALLADHGNAVARVGWRPITTVHPRDLELSRVGETVLVEVKMVYGGRITAAVRIGPANCLPLLLLSIAETAGIVGGFLGESRQR
jgi:hypothetical protein